MRDSTEFIADAELVAELEGRSELVRFRGGSRILFRKRQSLRLSAVYAALDRSSLITVAPSPGRSRCMGNPGDGLEVHQLQNTK